MVTRLKRLLRQFYFKHTVLTWFLIWLTICFIVFGFVIKYNGNSLLGNAAEQILGGSYPDAKWIIVKAFNGYQTKLDPSKVDDGANPQGQNTTANNGDRISIRDFGYDLFPSGTASTTAEPITGIHNFRKRDGTNVLMRAHGTFMDYYDESADTWEVLKSNYTSGKIFGFADFNINTDMTSYVYFGNATDAFSRWTGANTNLSSALAIDDSWVYVDSINDFILATGTIAVCGTELVYSSASTTLNAFYLSASSTISCADGRGVAEAIDVYNNNPKGNIYLAQDNRLFISGEASTSQAVYFSEYGDADNFANTLVADSTDTSPGVFNLGEGGGPVTSLAADESSIYIFKKSTVRKATLSDTTYTLGSLKPFDGKSQTIGSVGINSVFTGGNTVFFTTPDNQIMALERVESLDYPQVVPISNPIQPTVDEFKFDVSNGIVFKDKAYFAVKSLPSVSYNDLLLVYNIKTKTWDSPILGWNIAYFTVYDDGNGEDLYFGDAVSPNIYKVIDEPNDNDFNVVANWRSKQFDFGSPQAQKQIVDFFVDGYIAENTTLTVSLLLDEDGYTQSFEHDIKGTDANIIYKSVAYNTLGLSAFGTNRFGSQEDLSGLKKFRAYLGKDFNPLVFYNAQVEFASDGINQGWEVTNFGFRVREYSQPEKPNLYQSFR